MEQYSIDIEPESGAQAAVEAITNILQSHNLGLGFSYDPEPLTMVLRDSSGNILGGLSGATNWGWLHIKLLAVSESLRGTGYGRKLLEDAEAAALARGCRFAHVDTFSFQALPFYQKNGYEIYGVLDNYSNGCQRFFLKKEIAKSE